MIRIFAGQSGETRRACDGWTRRNFLAAGSLTALGWGLPELLRAREISGESSSKKTQSIIFMFAGGGPSQMETFDPKSDVPSEYKAGVAELSTKTPGLKVSEHLPRIAKMVHKTSILRAVSHTNSEHERGSHYMMTGHLPPRENPPKNLNPNYGAVVSKELGARKGVPPYCVVPGPANIVNRFNGPAFLGAAYGPFMVSGEPTGPEFGARDVTAPKQISEERMRRRLNLRQGVEEELRRIENDPDDPVSSMDTFYRQALEMVTSPAARAAFDISREPEAVRDRYGRTFTGQSTLLARRLVESGVRFVTVHRNGWDTHDKEKPRLRDELLPEFDQSYSTLINDLEDRGLLESTLVVWFGEFGRTPRYNKKGGRDHWPNTGVAALAGGGVQGGRVIGETDAKWIYPTDRPVSPEEIAATIFHAVGIDYRKQYTALGRPVPMLANDSDPIRELF